MINKGASHNGDPLGIKIDKNLSPCFIKAAITTVINNIDASKKVIIIWLVAVKLYGTIPNKFMLNVNINRVKAKGKNFIASLPAFSINIFLKKDFKQFKYTLTTLSGKDVRIVHGPTVRLADIAKKRIKRRTIQLMRKPT